MNVLVRFDCMIKYVKYIKFFMRVYVCNDNIGLIIYICEIEMVSFL